MGPFCTHIGYFKMHSYKVISKHPFRLSCKYAWVHIALLVTKEQNCEIKIVIEKLNFGDRINYCIKWVYIVFLRDTGFLFVARPPYDVNAKRMEDSLRGTFFHNSFSVISSYKLHRVLWCYKFYYFGKIFGVFDTSTGTTLWMSYCCWGEPPVSNVYTWLRERWLWCLWTNWCSYQSWQSTTVLPGQFKYLFC